MCAKSHIPPVQLNAEQKQHQQLTQRLIMSHHMQQAIYLLQLPVQELETFIEEQVVINPILEIEEQEPQDEGEDPTSQQQENEGRSPSAIKI